MNNQYCSPPEILDNGVLLSDKGEYELFSKKVNIIFFVFSLLLGVTGIFLEKFATGRSSPFGTRGEYLQLFFLLAAVLLSVIGYRRNIRNEFFKSLFHGYLVLLIFLASASVVLAVVYGGNLDGLHFLHLVILYLYWSVLIFLLPMGIVLFFIRKLKSKKYLRIGYAAAITVFAVLFHICHYFVLQEIGAAIAAAAITSIGV